jgi:transcriptional regulator with XRE-family HTH domain
MFVQPEQIRAARAMLDWSQQRLADAAGVSKDTVKNYELSLNKPNSQTMERIIGTLELSGIEFIGDGVRREKREIQTLEGTQGIRAFFDLVYDACLKNPAAAIQVANVDEELFVKWMGENDAPHRERMRQLGPRQIQSLVRTGVARTVAGDYSQYKSLDINQFGRVIIYIFGERTALIEMTDMVCKITLIENPLLSETMSKFFNLAWETAKPL